MAQGDRAGLAGGDWLKQTFSTRPPRMAVVFLVLFFLFVVTSLLSNAYHDYRQNLSVEHYRSGQSAAQQESYGEAIEHYRVALAQERGNQHYRLALALALMETGRVNEAESHFGELLQRDPTHGLANLMMARISTVRGRMGEAQRFYRRAIYGLWSGEPVQNRLKARFELVGLLAREGARKQMLAELLMIQDEAGDDPDLQKRIARLFFQAEDPDNAAGIYRELLQTHRRDPEVLLGLSRAEFQRANYLTAQRWLRSTLAVDSGNTAARELLERSQEVIALDPTMRWLSSTARLARSRKLLEIARTGLQECGQKQEGLLPEGVQETLVQSEALLEQKIRPQERAETAEAYLSVAEQLWVARQAYCRPAAGPEETASLVFAKLSQ